MNDLMRRDWVIMLILPLAAAAISLFFHLRFLAGTFWFLVVPALYLSWRNPKLIQKPLAFSLMFGFATGIIVNYIMEATSSWGFPAPTFDPVYLFGVINLEPLLWWPPFYYLNIITYKYFFDSKVPSRTPNQRYLVMILLAALTVFTVLIFTKPELLLTDFFYLKICILLAIVPTVLVVATHPFLMRKFAVIGTYFFFFAFLYEYVGLALGHWSFPNSSQFIGFVQMGRLQFPIEELFAWIVFGAPGTLAYFEFFSDDEK